MPDVAHRLHQHREVASQRLVVDHFALPRHRSDSRTAISAGDALEFGNLVDVDDDEGLTHPQVEKRHQRLPTGQYRRAPAGFGENRAGLLDSGRRDIVEGSGLQGFAPSINRRSTALSSITTGAADRRPYSKAAS